MNSRPEKTNSLFALGFRPFFLAAGLASVILMLGWLLVLTGNMAAGSYMPIHLWHAHEMIFGFIASVMAGFLLTAVQAWTGIPGLRGKPLLCLFVLWLLARVLFFLPLQIHPTLIALVDLSFIPAVMLIMASFVIRAKQWRNAIFIPVLLLFFFANLLVHLDIQNVYSSSLSGIDLGLWLVILLVILLGGRVLPMFTSNGLGGLKTYSWAPVNMAAILGFILFACADLFDASSQAKWLACFCVVFHSVRLYGWRPHLTLATPLLWVLHVGYAWLIFGFLLYALSDTLGLPRSIIIHAFAGGCIGNFVIGMMSRVALGHTARPLVPARLMALAYLLVNLATVVRVIFIAIEPGRWFELIVVAGLAWILAYSIFVYIYLPILSRPRLDGKPG